ncbi:hypothetical protein D3C73_283990 [compost metagenome]
MTFSNAIQARWPAVSLVETQRQAAADMGLSLSQVQKLCLGARVPGTKSLVAIKKHLPDLDIGTMIPDPSPQGVAP